MAHPFEEWNRKRLEEYKDTTETLTLEYKSCRALIPSDSKDRNTRLNEAAKDVAAMANEQGGVIIYGIEESTGGVFRRAVALEEGFKPEDGVSREWFLQFIRHRVQPPLPDIDAVDVPLRDDRSRHALIVLVPQARGVARQTEDHYFWRRDSHGLRTMSVQEIEDVRARTTRPVLDLDAYVGRSTTGDNRIKLSVQFRISNKSSATAFFAIVTVVLPSHVSLSEKAPSWQYWVEANKYWSVCRQVIASESSLVWSPITPGYVLATPGIEIAPDFRGEVDPVQPRAIGLARLDHDGGHNLYVLMLNVSGELERRLYLETFAVDNPPPFLDGRALPSLFSLDS